MNWDEIKENFIKYHDGNYINSAYTLSKLLYYRSGTPIDSLLEQLKDNKNMPRYFYRLMSDYTKIGNLSKKIHRFTSGHREILKLLSDCKDQLIEYGNLLENQNWTRHQEYDIKQNNDLIKRIDDLLT